MYFSNLSLSLFVSMKISRLPLGRDVYIFPMELKAEKHFGLGALLYFKLASSMVALSVTLCLFIYV